MSAVVHTGSSETRSACGTKVIVFADSAPTMRGAARELAPTRADLRKVRRFISVSLCRLLSLLAPPTPAGNQVRDLARCTQFYPSNSVGFGVIVGHGAPTGRRGARIERNRARSGFFVAMVINEPSLHTNTQECNLIQPG